MITTAEEARKLATEQRAEVSPSYQTCIEDINWAARHGKYSVIFHMELRSQDKKALKEKGFNLILQEVSRLYRREYVHIIEIHNIVT